MVSEVPVDGSSPGAGTPGYEDAGRDTASPLDVLAGIGDAGRDTASASEVRPGPGWAGIPGIEDLSKVSPSAGCGRDPGQALGTLVRHTITIVPKPIRGTGNREYFLRLPAAYDKTKPYRLIFEGPGCGQSGSQLIDYRGVAGAAGVIEVGLSPEPGVFLGGCFDNSKTDSIEYGFFDAVYQTLQKQLCFDQHRVFVSGMSSGGMLANMMGCVYGSTLVRAIGPAAGTLETAPGKAPPSNRLPTPGIFQWNEDDTDPTHLARPAISRALMVNGCKGDFATSPRAPYPVPSSTQASTVCEQFTTCPKEFPIVFCHPKTGGHSLPSYFPAAAWQFFTSF